MSNHSLAARGTDPPFSHKSVVSITREQNIICSETLICRQLFAGQLVGSRPMKRKEKKIYRMIITIMSSVTLIYTLMNKILLIVQVFFFFSFPQNNKPTPTFPAPSSSVVLSPCFPLFSKQNACFFLQLTLLVSQHTILSCSRH